MSPRRQRVIHIVAHEGVLLFGFRDMWPGDEVWCGIAMTPIGYVDSSGAFVRTTGDG